MKKYFILAAAALTFAACTNDEIVPVEQVQETVDDGAINFSAYVNRGLTRAGAPGVIDNTSIQNGGAHAGVGFGVFAYYTDNGNYSKYAVPDFMYNQQVTHGASGWTYSPIKYWPNEFGSTANSYDADKVSFFAYAPWVQVDVTSGIPNAGGVDVTKNITRLTSNTASGDPCIKYVVDTDAKTSVDLLWGVAPASTNYTTVTGPAESTVTEGMPYVDLLKSDTTSKVNFNLRHALAKLNVNIDAFVDATNNSLELDEKTRIFVRSVTFTGIALQGSLNLYNTEADKPNWYEYDGVKKIGTNSEAVTFYDGRRDGKEATTNGEQKNEKPTGLNLDLIQNERAISGGVYATADVTHNPESNIPAGVTNTPVNLFETDQSATSPIFVIPTGEEMAITIVYDVETIDPSLSTYLSDGVTHGSTIENRIFKEDVFAAVEAGKAYQVNLHLGMTSVKFEANVVDWDALVTEDVDLPHNSPKSVAAANPATEKEVEVAYDLDTYIFTVTGLNDGEGVTYTKDGTVVTAATGEATATSAGVATVTVTLEPNTKTTINDDGWAQAAGSASSKAGKLKFIQGAAPLDFTAATYDDGTHEVTCTISNTDVTELNASGIIVTMTKDDAEFTDFTLAASKVITLTSYAAGTYKVTIKANDADPVTVSFVIS
jgi:hypothetical protein